MTLNRGQRDSLWLPDGKPYEGNRVVAARPGTGKTKTLTDYCVELAEEWSTRRSPWQGIAAISFTNVAREELEDKFQRSHVGATLLAYPHFTGTIDAFLNQHVFLPFGGIQMASTGRPKLVGEPHGTWRSEASKGADDEFSPAFFANYSFSISGEIVKSDNRKVWVGSRFVEAPSVTSENSTAIEKMKLRLWATGVATQTDANLLSYLILSENALLTNALIGRFPVIVIDEAQDMTEVQHALIDHLIQSGHRHVILVGDELQSIYEWNTARPELFIAKTQNAETWSPKVIKSTYRSSPAICRFLTNLADGTELIAEPTAKNASYGDRVRVITYLQGNASTIAPIVANRAIERLHDKDAHSGLANSPKRLALLGRSGDDALFLRSALTGEAHNKTGPPVFIHRLSRDFLKTVHCLQSADIYRAFQAYEGLLLNASKHKTRAELRRALGLKWARAGETFEVAYRRQMSADLAELALKCNSLPMSISESVQVCAVELQGLSQKNLDGIARDLSKFGPGEYGRENRRVEDVFRKENDSAAIYSDDEGESEVHVYFSTVHGVKGETYDSVVYYTRARTKPCGCPSNSRRMADILGHDIRTCETKRLAYVATSRAAQSLYILAPEESVEAWRALLHTNP